MIRSRWFHVPVLHSALSGRAKKVTWLELFYDLMFVAAFSQLAEALSEEVSIQNLFLFIGHFVPLWMAWTGFTFFNNRFDVDDSLHRTLVFLKMVTIGAMAIGSSEAMAGQPLLFTTSFATSQLLLAGMYLRSWRQVANSRPYCAFWGGVSFAAAAIFSTSLLLDGAGRYLSWGLGIMLLLLAPISKQSMALRARFPSDFEHLSERFGLLTIIVLGESFVEILAQLADAHGTLGDHGMVQQLLHGAFNMLLTYGIWWLYFDDIAGAELKKHPSAGSIWYATHLPLSAGITLLGLAVGKTIDFGPELPGTENYRWLLAGSLASILLCFAVIDSITVWQRARLSDRSRVASRAVAAVMLLVLAATGDAMSGSTFLLLVAVLTTSQVLFDLVFSPFEGHKEEGEPPSTATAPQGTHDTPT